MNQETLLELSSELNALREVVRIDISNITVRVTCQFHDSSNYVLQSFELFEGKSKSGDPIPFTLRGVSDNDFEDIKRRIFIALGELSKSKEERQKELEKLLETQ